MIEQISIVKRSTQTKLISKNNATKQGFVVETPCPFLCCAGHLLSKVANLKIAHCNYIAFRCSPLADLPFVMFFLPLVFSLSLPFPVSFMSLSPSLYFVFLQFFFPLRTLSLRLSLSLILSLSCPCFSLPSPVPTFLVLSFSSSPLPFFWGGKKRFHYSRFFPFHFAVFLPFHLRSQCFPLPFFLLPCTFIAPITLFFRSLPTLCTRCPTLCWICFCALFSPFYLFRKTPRNFSSTLHYTL